MEIPDFYRGRSVLLTGGTGFIGKALLEKLLRCCPEVERLYVLVRRKRDTDPQKRVAELLALPVFAGCAVDKVTAVAGDASLPGLGLSDEDRDVLVQRVSVVLHSAATVSFTEPLGVAVPINVEAVHHVVQLTRDMKQLAVLVHVSTAYSNCNLASVREEIYPPPADPRDIIRKAKDEADALEKMTPQLVGDRPNTYTFTKALAESLLAEEAADLPVAIVRPSIVGWAWREPSPGYTDNANGAIGPLLMMGQGAVRAAVCREDRVADIVPVDIVVNTILAVTWHTARQRPPPPDAVAVDGAAPRPPAPPAVYNCVTGQHNPLQWGYLVDVWMRGAREEPSASALWWPSCHLTSSYWRYRVRTFITMVLPAAIHDHVVAPLLEKPPTMMRKQKKLLRLMESIAFFSTHGWEFKDDNVRALWSLLSGRDQTLFPMDVASVDWDSYLKTARAGSKRHLLKEEGPSGNASRLYLLHILSLTALITSLLALVGWAFWPVLARFYPSSTINFILFLLSKSRSK